MQTQVEQVLDLWFPGSNLCIGRAAMAMGRFTISPRELAAVLVPGRFPGGVLGQVRTVISNIRSPRVPLALLSGAGLAAAGAAFQGLFANPWPRRTPWGAPTAHPLARCLGSSWGCLHSNPAVGHDIGNRGSA